MEAFRRKAQRLAIMPETGFLPRLLHEQADFTFPMSPADYDTALAVNVDVLRFLHPHLRDLGVRFEAANHEYFVGGAKMKHSVTGLIHKFCEPFNAEAVIGFMMKGQNWPRPGYLQRVIPFDAVTKLHLLSPELLPLLAGSPRDDPRICDVLRALSGVFGLEDEISRLVLSPEQIKIKWAADAKEAACYGTYMHNLFEAYLNGYDVPRCSPEFRMLCHFLANMPTSTKAWRTEWVIYGEEEGLAGSVDFCARKDDGTLIVVDWKRSAGLPSKCTSARRMLGPLSHLPDCTVTHYKLPLNTYRYILEKYYDVKVSEMYIVCCHPEHGTSPWVCSVPRLEAETELMLAHSRDFPGGATAPPAESKRWRVRHDLLQRYADLVLQFPCVEWLCPTPTDYRLASKRQWERAMRNARVTLALLQREQYYILYMFLHTQHKRISLPHPMVDFRATEWVPQAVASFLEHERQTLPGVREVQPADLQGGSLLPDELFRYIAISSPSTGQLYQLQACCRRFREVILQRKSWQNLHVHLDTFANESDDDFARAIRLLPVWSSARQVIVSYRLLGRMPLSALPSNLKMTWSVRAAEPATLFNCTCFAWESVENLFGSAEFAVRCMDPDSTMIVGVKKRNDAQPWPLASQPRAVFLRLQNPFGRDMRASFGRSNEQFLDLPGVRGPCQGRNFEHDFAVQWVGRELRITINGVLLPILRLRPEVAASLGAHTKLFVRFFSSSADAQASFSVRPLPCTVQSTSCVSCFRCQALSTVGTGAIRPCTHCLEWFCRWHRDQVSDREICHSCANVWTDAVGGSTGDPVVEVQTQASQDSFAASVHEDIQHQLAVQDAQDAVSAQLKSEEIEERAADVELEAQDDSAWAALKRRRLLPGAATSDRDFRELFAGLEQYRAVFEHEASEVTEELNSIPNFVSRYRARIPRDYPGMSEYMIKLMTAAVAVLGLRTVDVFQQENAMMLWIIEGETHMRFHHGDCYILHNSGAFQHYKGSPLDCRLFRQLPPGTRRTEHEVLQAVAVLLTRADSERDFLATCRSAAVNNAGDSLIKNKQAHAAPQADEGDAGREGEGEVPASHWNIYSARMIISFERNIIREMAEDKLISYMIEFCEQPMMQVSGCCYNDCCVIYPGASPAEQVLLLQ
ncbi:unnamed protein product [Symbiodinium sp. CCMP2592]|nr:unnamed protein product [Symbiodinium sp. CCMP2592]